MVIYMTDEIDGEKPTAFVTRYFVETDNNSYVVAMFVACTEIEVTQCESTQLTEVSTKVYESIGPNSQYVDGEVVQGEPRKTPLTKESADAVRQSLVELAVKSISVVQLKLQAGRKLTDTERVKLDSVLDYIDALSAIDTSKAPDIEFPPQSL